MAKAKATTKKAALKGTVIPKGAGGMIPASFTEQFLADLKNDATKASANMKTTGGGKFLSIKGGVFSIKNDVKGPEVRAVLLATAHLNEYYDKPYDPNKKGVTPKCFALSPDGENMVPHTSVAEKEAEACDGCWAAELGTALQGKGRACKRVARVAMILEEDLKNLDTAGEAELVQLKVPTMSKDNLSSYISLLEAKHQLPPYAVVCTLTVAPHPQYQFTVSFTPLEVVNDPEIIQVLQRRARGEATDATMAPFQSVKKDEEESKGGKGAPKKKAALAKTSATRGGRSRFGN